MTGDVRSQTRSYGRTAGLLTVALATAGGLAYVFFAVASHSLDPEDYGQIVVLWSVVFLLVSTLFRPVEQLLAKTVAETEERGGRTTHAIRVGAGIQLGIGLAFASAAFAFKGRIENELFDGDSLFFWVLVFAVLGFSASYYVRGFFAGSRRMGSYAALLVFEGVARLGLALVVAVGISEGRTLIAIAIAAAPIASLAIVPFALAKGGGQAEALPPDSGPTAADGVSDLTIARGGGFAAAVLLIMLSEQVLLNSGVLFVRASEGAAAAGFIFNVLLVVRAPVVLFQAVAASLLPHLTRLSSRGGETSADAFAQSVRLTIMVIAVFATTIALTLLTLGPQAMQVAFSDKFEYDRTGLLIVAVGMAFYLIAATLSQAALAVGQVRKAAACWVAAAVLFVAFNFLPTSDAFRRVELGFAISAALLCAGLYALYRNPRRVVMNSIEPGSSREVEVRLAAADDII